MKMNKRNGVIVGALAIALVIVLVLWMRDRESQDLKIDLDIGAAAGTTDGAIVAVRHRRAEVLLSNDASTRPID
jgi:hypothetical protein